MSLENPVPQADLKTIVGKSLENLRVSNYKGMEARVDYISEMIASGGIRLIEIGGHLPWLTNFTLEIGGDVSERMPRGVILVDTSRSVVERVIDSDLARTVFIASQFPESGYENRLCDVYSSALKKHKEWLTKTGAKFGLLDARLKWPGDKEDYNFHLKQLLGAETLLLDFGFKDWKNAVTDKALDLQEEQLEDWRSQVTRLNEVMESKEVFFRERCKFHRSLFDARELGSNLSLKVGGMDPSTRAGFASRVAVRQFLSKPSSR